MKMSTPNLVGVFFSLDENMGELRKTFDGLPLDYTSLFNLTFKLWELRAKAPMEYEDELFSAITSAILNSKDLKTQLQSISQYDDNEGDTVTHLADKLTSVAVSRVDAAITLLDKPLALVLKDLLTSSWHVHNVTVSHTDKAFKFYVTLNN